MSVLFDTPDDRKDVEHMDQWLRGIVSQRFGLQQCSLDVAV